MAEGVTQSRSDLPFRDLDPPERLRALLAADRAHGVSFDVAWRERVAQALSAPLGPTDRDLWTEAIVSLEAQWRAGYERADRRGTAISRELIAA